MAGALAPGERDEIARAGFVACVACTDVHEYGKLLIEATLRSVGVHAIDGGVSADADAVAAAARDGRADFIAVSTYNGVALAYLQTLRSELSRIEFDIPIFIGGKLNQVPEGSRSGMPVDVSRELRALGAFACTGVEDMLAELLDAARERNA